MGSPEGGNDPHGDGLADAEGVADGQDDVTNLEALGLGEGDDRQRVRGRNLQHREVRLGITPDEFGGKFSSVVESNFDFVGGLDDVIIRQDVSLGADDDARPKPGRLTLNAGARTVAKKMAKKGIVLKGVARPRDILAGKDVHHRRHRMAHRVGIG